MPEDFQQRAMVLDELRRATDTGEPRSFAQLQAACGIGSGDLAVVLRELHQGGLVSQVAPGEWEMIDALDEESAGEVDPVEAATHPMTFPTAVPAHTLPPLPGPSWAPVSPLTARRPSVAMPRAVANVLDAAALGALVKAGIDTAVEGETFTFEVTP